MLNSELLPWEMDQSISLVTTSYPYLGDPCANVSVEERLTLCNALRDAVRTYQKNICLILSAKVSSKLEMDMCPIVEYQEALSYALYAMAMHASRLPDEERIEVIKSIL